MNNSLSSLLRIYSAGEVQRCHTERVLYRQSTADHSWGVALICAWICCGAPSARLILAALTHDSPEKITGDVPATAKIRNPRLVWELDDLERGFAVAHEINYELDATEMLVLRIADYAELALYCLAELRMGNSGVMPMLNTAVGLVTVAIRQMDKANAPTIYKRAMEVRTYLQGRLTIGEHDVSE